MKKNIQFNLLFIVTAATLISFQQDSERGYAEVNGTRLYYEITGTGTPLVFLHDFTCDHRNWNPQVKYFSDNYKVITYDARGHGRSSLPNKIPYSYEEDLSTLLDYLKINKAVVIGHSLGGGAAFSYALHNPGRVLGLVLAEGGLSLKDPAIIDTSLISDFFSEVISAIGVARKEGLEEGKKAWLNIHAMKRAYENPVSSELLKTMIDDYSGWHWLHRDPFKADTDGTIEMLENIKSPTLLLAGELSHPYTKEFVSIHSKYIPNSKLEFIKKSNHMLNIENPDQFNKELESFLMQNDIK